MACRPLTSWLKFVSVALTARYAPGPDGQNWPTGLLWCEHLSAYIQNETVGFHNEWNSSSTESERSDGGGDQKELAELIGPVIALIHGSSLRSGRLSSTLAVDTEDPRGHKKWAFSTAVMEERNALRATSRPLRPVSRLGNVLASRRAAQADASASTSSPPPYSRSSDVIQKQPKEFGS